MALQEWTDKIHHDDCMELLPGIPDKSIDMILCDLPYGILECRWDKKLPAEALFEQYNRVIKDNGAIVLTATCKFGIELINANRKYFRYDLVWEKSSPVGFANCNRQPMRSHELILVFYKRQPTYNPQGLVPVDKPMPQLKRHADKDYAYRRSLDKPYTQRFTGYPRSVLRFGKTNSGKTIHPTKKPLDMFKYLILTYTNPGDVVLDNCIGSGTTAVAAIETGRQFIGIELDEEYYMLACQQADEARRAMDTSV